MHLGSRRSRHGAVHIFGCAHCKSTDQPVTVDRGIHWKRGISANRAAIDPQAIVTTQALRLAILQRLLELGMQCRRRIKHRGIGELELLVGRDCLVHVLSPKKWPDCDCYDTS